MESRPIRVFLDSNVLFSAAYSRSGPPADLLDAAAAGRFVPVLSSTVIDEAARNLTRKAPGALARLEKVFGEVQFEVVSDPPRSEVEACSQAGFGSDAPIVAAAFAADVEYLCTGDRGLLGRASGGAFANVRAVSPAELVRLLADLP